MGNEKLKNIISFLVGPLAFLAVLIMPLDSLNGEARVVLGATVWMAIWWISGVLPMAVTALLPIVLFPLGNSLGVDATCMTYFHPLIVMIMGGFIIARAIEDTGLHRRIALWILNITGPRPRQIIIGFMLSTSLLSMWISNTATTIMMLPIALAVTKRLSETDWGIDISKFRLTLLLCIAWSASIGGMTTLIGTPTNAVFSGVMDEQFGVKYGFIEWAKLGVPAAVLIWMTVAFLSTRAFKKTTTENHEVKSLLKQELKALGKLGVAERRVLIIFLMTALLWIFRSLLQNLVPEINDTSIAMFGSLLLFVIPSGENGHRLLSWESAARIPWDVLILIGGGLVIAAGFRETGLAEWIGGKLLFFESWPVILLIFVVVLCVNFLTEITSNTATASIMLPILGSMAVAIGMEPAPLMAGASMAASCAYMLPVATPPNAIVFGSGHLTIKQMAKAGFKLNLISSVIICLWVYLLSL